MPLHIKSFDKRLQIPRRLIEEVFPDLGANHVFCNIEYEVDELRRDIATVKKGREKGIDVVCLHDRLVVPPGRIVSQAGKPMSVYSPWQRSQLPFSPFVEEQADLFHRLGEPSQQGTESLEDV